MQGYLKTNQYPRNIGFTLIELMIVLSIVALILTMVGPFALNIIDKAQAKQERLSIENWLSKVSALSFYSGQTYKVEFNGNAVSLFSTQKEQTIEKVSFDSLFFQPQTLVFNSKGNANQTLIQGSFKGQPMPIDLTLLNL